MTIAEPNPGWNELKTNKNSKDPQLRAHEAPGRLEHVKYEKDDGKDAGEKRKRPSTDPNAANKKQNTGLAGPSGWNKRAGQATTAANHGSKYNSCSRDNGKSTRS